MSSSLGTFLEIESAPLGTITTPARAHQNIRSADTPNDYELDELQWGKVLSGPPTGPQTSNELESSQPPTPKTEDAAEVVQSLSSNHMNKWRLAAACLMSLGNGLNDSGPGALIPHIQSYYHIGYFVVSLIFVLMAVGFLAAAPWNHVLEAKLGRGKLYMLSMVLMVCGYIIIACAPPFPVVVVSFLPVGFGFAVNLALSNVFCANLASSTTSLGFLHGSYGIGGTIGPLVATTIVNHGGRWSLYYLIPLLVMMASFFFAGWSFWTYEKDLPAQLLTALERRASRDPDVPKKELLKRALRNRTTLLGALFIFAYQGAEVSISGWVISFLIKYRSGDPSRVGYVTAGFWAGITIGRFFISPFAHRLGERTSVFVLTAGSIAFELLVWLVPNVIGEAIAVSIVGLLLGPVYPCATAVYSKLLPRNMQMSSLSFISAMGSSGGAVAPFVVGLLSQKVGTVILHPIVIALFVVMMVSWAFLPRIVKRRE